MKNESEKKANNTKRSPWIVDERKCLVESEIQELLKIVREIKHQGIKEHRFSLIRKWFMVELGLKSGLRVGEMASLNQSNLFIEEGRSSILVYGKGGKKRSVLISLECKDLCFEYLELKSTHGYIVGDDEPLFINLVGNRISKRALQKDFKSVLTISGLSSHYHIHCLRHTYTTILLKTSGYNYRFVQKQLGHASIRTTQVYAGVIEKEGREAIEKMSLLLS